MSKRLEVAARDAELKGDEALIAARVMEWFDLLVKLRAAHAANDDQQMRPLITRLITADPAHLEGVQIWLTVFLMERFKAEFEQLDVRLRQIAAGEARARCPYTIAQYDAAVATVGTKQELLAAELKVDRKTLRKYGRPTD